MKHLDLGCGRVPRNPYSRAELFGVDIAAMDTSSEYHRRANLALDSIPFPACTFDSVSAFDFFEHIPRVLPTSDGMGTRLPFIELMNEVWRVLVPGGLLYASTPVYPHEATFRDPTHVNYITTRTHEYFVRPAKKAAMYGFVGDFVEKRVQLARPNANTVYISSPVSFSDRLKQMIAHKRGRLTHIIWELEAIK